MFYNWFWPTTCPTRFPTMHFLTSRKWSENRKHIQEADACFCHSVWWTLKLKFMLNVGYRKTELNKNKLLASVTPEVDVKMICWHLLTEFRCVFIPDTIMWPSAVHMKVWRLKNAGKSNIQQKTSSPSLCTSRTFHLENIHSMKVEFCKASLNIQNICWFWGGEVGGIDPSA